MSGKKLNQPTGQPDKETEEIEFMFALFKKQHEEKYAKIEEEPFEEKLPIKSSSENVTENLVPHPRYYGFMVPPGYKTSDEDSEKESDKCDEESDSDKKAIQSSENDDVKKKEVNREMARTMSDERKISSSSSSMSLSSFDENRDGMKKKIRKSKSRREKQSGYCGDNDEKSVSSISPVSLTFSPRGLRYCERGYSTSEEEEHPSRISHRSMNSISHLSMTARNTISSGINQDSVNDVDDKTSNLSMTEPFTISHPGTQVKCVRAAYGMICLNNLCENKCNDYGDSNISSPNTRRVFPTADQTLESMGMLAVQDSAIHSEGISQTSNDEEPLSEQEGRVD